MLSIETEKTSVSKTNRQKSEEAINAFLATVVKETKTWNSDRKVRVDAMAVIDEMNASGELDGVRPQDVERAQKKIRKQKDKHGFRSWLNYQNRGRVQDFMHDLSDFYADKSIPFEEKLLASAKAIVAVGAVSAATGALTQAFLGASNYDKMLGASQEKLISDFIMGNDHYQSLMPVVAGVTAAAIVAKAGVSFYTKPRSEAEAKKFEEYADIKHSQIALKQLKRFLKSQKPERKAANGKNDMLQVVARNRALTY